MRHRALCAALVPAAIAFSGCTMIPPSLRPPPSAAVGRTVEQAQADLPGRIAAIRDLSPAILGEPPTLTARAAPRRWTIVAACPAPGPNRPADLAVGAIPASAMTRAIANTARHHGFDSLLAECRRR